MVAKISIGKKIRGALHYNEHKVAEGKAELILASSFAGDIDKMNFNQKLQRFEKLLMLKPSVKTNTLHISLNFDAAEKLDDETMQRIAIAYMDKIGFGDQPYLAYQHHDAAHHHIHLVTTNIQANAAPIDLHNIGCIKSENARKEIEEEFKLVKAQSKQYKAEPGIKPIDLQKALYGNLPTKRAISNTVNAVISTYKFTSIAELNAVLKPFNVIADRGADDTQMFQKGGLIYSLLDTNGNKTGVPIKSSSLYTKPTLAYLQKQFALHNDGRLPYKSELKEKIDRILTTKPSQKAFTEALQKQGVAVVLRQSATRQTYGITFVDHNSKTVFNGSDLGKNYSAKAITNQLTAKSLQSTKQPLTISKERIPNSAIDLPINKDWAPSPQPAQLLTTLFEPANDYASLMPKKKRRKKKSQKI